MLEIGGLALVVSVLVVVNGLFVAAEFAIIGVRETRLRGRAEAGQRPARWVVGVLTDPDGLGRYFATTQLGITAASLGLGMYGERELAVELEPLLVALGLDAGATTHAVAVVVAVSLLTYLHVVLGEMIPKSLALQFPEQTALRLAPLMALARALAAPVVVALNRTGSAVLRLLRIPAEHPERRILTAEELGRVVSESTAGGLIKPRLSAFLRGILDLSSREVHQVMTPRTRVVAFDVTTPAEDLTTALAASRHTRFPIYDGDLDHVIGTLHLKDFIRATLAPDTPIDLRALARRARLVPEHMPVEDLLETFRQERSHMAIVLDEYGGTAGLVTLEDLAEEIVGEVHDEFDVAQVDILPLRPGVFDVRGDVQLVDLGEHITLPKDRPDVDTVGGLVVTLLGRPAREGDVVRLGRLRLHVRSVRGLAIDRVRVRRGDASDEPRM